MNKIPTLLVRDPDNRRYVTAEINPDCEWVLDGKGTPRRKYDGTCVMLDEHGNWWARREVKQYGTPPPGWFSVEGDPVTGKVVGWEPAGQSSFIRFLNEAILIDQADGPFEPGTYELCGPKINGNPDGMTRHVLIRHDTAMTPDDLYDFNVWDNTPAWPLVSYVGQKYGWEGIVWHHPDGRMAKLKYRDLPSAERAAV